MVRLYADFAREKLLPLLRRSDNYPIQEALDICSQRQYYPEMVYLLGRIGNTSDALALMTRELNDMESAIAFCQEHDDEELWNDLINYSLDKPGFYLHYFVFIFIFLLFSNLIFVLELFFRCHNFLITKNWNLCRSQTDGSKDRTIVENSGIEKSSSQDDV